ncbi:MAG: hypothetical protein H8E17_20985 [Deltaproteobacteria bacterium]|nr:hypothetical protein [Deltaproteobacteria bacterium]
MKVASLAEALQEVKSDLVRNLGNGDKIITLAILCIHTLEDENNGLTDFISLRLTTLMGGAYVRKNMIQAVERKKIDEVEEELKLQENVLFDRENRAKLGMLLGANALLMGTVTRSDRHFSLDITVVEVATGKILHGCVTQFVASPDVLMLWDDKAKTFIDVVKDVSDNRTVKVSLAKFGAGDQTIRLSTKREIHGVFYMVRKISCSDDMYSLLYLFSYDLDEDSKSVVFHGGYSNPGEVREPFLAQPHEQLLIAIATKSKIKKLDKMARKYRQKKGAKDAISLLDKEFLDFVHEYEAVIKVGYQKITIIP